MEKFDASRRIAGSAAEHWSDADFQDAEENLRQYVALALRIFERLQLDPEAMARFEALTASRRDRTINGKGRQNNSQAQNA